MIWINYNGLRILLGWTPPPNHCFSDPKKQKLPPLVSVFHHLSIIGYSSFSLKLKSRHSPRHASFVSFSGGDEGGGEGGGRSRGSGGCGGGGSNEDAGERNKAEAIMALVEVGRSLDSIPKDLAAAIEGGKVSGSIVHRFFELEKSPFLGWLLRFGGFKERLLADDLFLTKVAIECGFGIFTKTAA